MKAVHEFLKQLCVNNNTQWFNENRAFYKQTRELFLTDIQKIIDGVRAFDSMIGEARPSDCVFRINRDTRFSKDKNPYKTNMGAFITPFGRSIVNAGYYLHIEPDNSFVAGGIYMPPSEQLTKIRTTIYNNPHAFISIVENPRFKALFGDIDGDKLSKAPRGIPRSFEYMELLKYKSYTVSHKLDDNFVQTQDVVKKALELFEVMKDFNIFLNNSLEG